jgi:hypothetical protein
LSEFYKLARENQHGAAVGFSPPSPVHSIDAGRRVTIEQEDPRSFTLRSRSSAGSV